MTEFDSPASADPLPEPDLQTVRSPVSGIENAIGAGDAFLPAADSLARNRVFQRVRKELPAYLSVQSSWYLAFGLQMVLFPYLITNVLLLDATSLGVANLALALPSVVFLLFGGVVAERMSSRTLLVMLHVAGSVPIFALAWALSNGMLSYPVMIAYAVAMGTIGAFMMPARDAVLNEVVVRRARTGSGVTLQQGVAFATLAQFAAQVIGLILAGYAGSPAEFPDWLGGFTIPAIAPQRLLVMQGIVMLCGVLAAIWLSRGRQVRTGRSGISAAFGDIADGFAAVRRDARLWAMSLLMLGVGVFVIGSFLVVLPILNRDVYGLSSDGLRDTFVTFWIGAFIAAVILSTLRSVKRPGRVLLWAQALAAIGLLVIVTRPNHAVFLGLVFLFGLAAGVSIATSRSIVQDAAPTDQLARVLSIYQLGFMAGAPLGAYVLGVLTDLFGETPERVVIVPAIGLGVLTAWMIVASPIWNLKVVRKTN